MLSKNFCIEDDLLILSVTPPQSNIGNQPPSDNAVINYPTIPIPNEHSYDSLTDAPASFDYSFMEHSEREALESINRFMQQNEMYQKRPSIEEIQNNRFMELVI